MIGILAAALAPAVMQQVMDRRVEATREEARVIYEAMVGPSTGETQFGFVGDVGRLPSSYQELTQPGGLPAFTTTTVRGVGIGWRGPYVNVGTSADDFLTDAFGRPYLGAATGQVRSAGPDGLPNTADDIAYPPSPATVTGHVSVTVRTMQGNKVIVDPSGYRVDLYYAVNGSETSISDASSPFTFSDVPMGLRALRVVKTSNPKAGSIVSEDVVVVRPGGTAAVELWF